MSKKAIQLLSPYSFRGLLSSARQDARVIAVDGSWYMPNNPRNAKEEFDNLRLENSRFFDLDAVKDNSSPYPHMLPSIEEFNQSVRKLGIKNSDKVIVYDKTGNFSAPRVVWTFSVFGHENVYLLNNFPEYERYKYPVLKDNDHTTPEPSDFEAKNFDKDAVISFEQFVEIVSNENLRTKYNILDARSHDRFTGEAPEPRPGLPSGHAPGAKSLPFGKVLGENNLFLDSSTLTKIVDSIGVDPEKPTIVMCGTGVTACILKTALDKIGYNKKGIQVYDGSWT
ncbi:3-mercaptopyruvate sulfurtransferase [Wickerhamomyces ciferrii]|uniref:3-mercaptopyruvate sulfurtransferase n=1 Tax=Wickerhamomyces ciferrii (strain ATCC 14091 / BCRC 22168 / CBS 111 / JCM 3599 / NBRC 0793 / NRRL Y-1031 F-60-10) TaxID=1206466 RepID=K0KE17_WICCF|nr:3-mercaptopyruvate sulfurtransferase [Wickerhamomyces ciferrii]CCH40487.1 3-mercaptopyruvate sulfurtransferase [Wickerhamomyces ciferrii]